MYIHFLADFPAFKRINGPPTKEQPKITVIILIPMGFALQIKKQDFLS